MDHPFTLAHFSDPHLPLPAGLVPGSRELMGKRLLAYLSWRRKRERAHNGDRLKALLGDVAAAEPDAVAVTGDLINLALPGEFRAAARWLEALGDPARVCLVPGNHDALVAVPEEQGIGAWHPWLKGDGAWEGFPTLRRRGGVALVGLSSARPTWPLLAGGWLGRAQLARVEQMLAELREQGLFRVVLIHHPPVDPGSLRIALWDALSLRKILRRVGAELVLHGHRHLWIRNSLPGPGGAIPVLGVPSASRGEGEHASRWNLHRISPLRSGWQLSTETRGWVSPEVGFGCVARWSTVIPRASRGARRGAPVAAGASLLSTGA
ncbi:metallophosphoesterase family protein [Roseomonas elaeocarpi]|uniref:Metallophosphoesterase family protein n=1 Tax=Roseomonas elaeocarpi TaxID=907779 RepID=A0ABV6JRD9_9PROT